MLAQSQVQEKKGTGSHAHLRYFEIMDSKDSNHHHGTLSDGDGAGDGLRDWRPGLWDALRVASRVPNSKQGKNAPKWKYDRGAWVHSFMRLSSLCHTADDLVCLFRIIGLQRLPTDLSYSHTSNRLEDDSLHFILCEIRPGYHHTLQRHILALRRIFFCAAIDLQISRRGMATATQPTCWQGTMTPSRVTYFGLDALRDFGTWAIRTLLDFGTTGLRDVLVDLAATATWHDMAWLWPNAQSKPKIYPICWLRTWWTAAITRRTSRWTSLRLRKSRAFNKCWRIPPRNVFNCQTKSGSHDGMEYCVLYLRRQIISNYEVTIIHDDKNSQRLELSAHRVQQVHLVICRASFGPLTACCTRRASRASWGTSTLQLSGHIWPNPWRVWWIARRSATVNCQLCNKRVIGHQIAQESWHMLKMCLCVCVWNSVWLR